MLITIKTSEGESITRHVYPNYIGGGMKTFADCLVALGKSERDVAAEAYDWLSSRGYLGPDAKTLRDEAVENG